MYSAMRQEVVDPLHAGTSVPLGHPAAAVVSIAEPHIPQASLS